SYVPITWALRINPYLSTPPDPNYFNWNTLLTFTAKSGCPSVAPVGSATPFGGNTAFVGEAGYPPTMYRLTDVIHTSRIIITGENYFNLISHYWPSTLDWVNNGMW